jgi:S1-C subfamily serine protease
MNKVLRIFIVPLALSAAAASASAAERQQQWAGTGVTVTQVVPHTAAASAGIRIGDVIVNVNGNAVNSYADIESQVAASGGRPMTIDLYRGRRLLRLHAAPRRIQPLTPYGVAEHERVLGLAHWETRLILIPCALEPDCE